ncbi:MAG: HlyD family efflux transporter periplasmic adaptor subunit [Desulfuromonadales bacterium]
MHNSHARKYSGGSLIFFLLPFFLGACQPSPEPVYQGYVEGEFVQVAAPLAGRLEDLAVRRGAHVAAGDPLFTLEREEEAAAVAAARQELAQTKNQLADLQKGQRPSELAAIEARLRQAQAALELSRQELTRRRDLFAQQMVSAEELDRARTAVQRDAAAVKDLRAQLTTARLGARADRIAAARAAVEAAAARLAQARWALEQKSRPAPVAGLVFDTFFEAGEFVPAGRPVVALLPPENRIVRFFVPEPMVGALAVGQPVRIAFDGRDEPVPARIDFISPQAEYTPPVIYSRETREKLVYLVEARPEAAAATLLHPGQPVSVRAE